MVSSLDMELIVIVILFFINLYLFQFCAAWIFKKVQ